MRYDIQGMNDYQVMLNGTELSLENYLVEKENESFNDVKYRKNETNNKVTDFLDYKVSGLMDEYVVSYAGYSMELDEYLITKELEIILDVKSNIENKKSLYKEFMQTRRTA